MLLTYKYRESSRAGLTVTVHNIVVLLMQDTEEAAVCDPTSLC